MGSSTPSKAKPAKARKAPEKPSQVSAPKKAKLTAPVTGDDGWTLHPPSLIYKHGHAKGSNKIAGFDVDGTLVKTMSGRDLPTSWTDWKLFNGNVPSKIQEYADDGYKIVIFSNQNGIRSALEGKAAENFKNRVDAIVQKLGMPVQVFAATEKDSLRKPEGGMWKFMLENCNDAIQPDISDCFYVGDFAGREGDKAASDKEFAENLKIKFYTPEEFFGAPGHVASDGPNGPVIDVLLEMAELLRRKGEAFRGNALAKAAKAIQDHGQELTTAKEAMKLPGVGKGSGGILEEVRSTGKCAALEELREEGGESGKAKAKEVAKAKSKGSAFKFM